VNPKAFLSQESDERRLFATRIRVAVGAALVLLLALVGRLAYVQIGRHAHYAALARDNLSRPLPLPPARGLILDRHGVVLAGNFPAYTVSIAPRAVPHLTQLLTRLKGLIGLNSRDLQRFRHAVQTHDSADFLPLRRNLTSIETARLAAHLPELPGVRLQAQLRRNYPFDGLADPVVGYVGPITRAEAAHHVRRDMGFQDVGQTGIERLYQRELMGRMGFKDVEENARGRQVRVLKRVPGRPGDNLYLTISAQMQAVAEQMFKGRRGAAVALNPRTGAVLALVSSPTYDPNPFVLGISRRRYAKLVDNPRGPLDNRALNGLYPPGSSIKPFYAYAALQTHWFHPRRRVLCRGTWHIPGNNHIFHDWLPWGMGRIGLEKALEESSDVYFYKLAYRMGIDRMARYLEDFGFGHATGIDLPGESAGTVPTPQWIQANDSPWYEGETIITGIGQGPLLVTPLQLADAMATLANHGVRMRPYVVRAVQNPLTKAVHYMKPHAYPAIPRHRPGSDTLLVDDLTHVISGSLGTAHIIAHRLPYAVAGKTGTAQLWSAPAKGKYKGPRLHSDALFTAMAPVPDPRIVVAVVLEHAGFGLHSAIPTKIARALINLDLLGHVHVRRAPKTLVARFAKERRLNARALTLEARTRRAPSMSVDQAG
jgi:penicillin-binding protein 2